MGILREYSTESVLIANRLGGLNQNPKFLGYNDQYDAFRHAYTSALFTEKFGTTVARWLGDANEEPYDPNGKHNDMTQQQYHAEKNMDLWNNNLGRQEYQNWKKAIEAGTTTDPLDKWIYDRVKEGATINDLLDNRVWTEPQSESNTEGRTGNSTSDGDMGTGETTPLQPVLIPDLEDDAADQCISLPVGSEVPLDNHHAPLTDIPPATSRQMQHENQGEQQGYKHKDTAGVNQNESDSGGLSAKDEKARQQTAVDPLMLDMRDDGLLFYSGQLRHGGWVDAGNGSLVWCYNNGSIIDNNSTAFSPHIHANYYNEFWPDADNSNDNEIIDILDAAWNLLKVWAGISDDVQGWMGGDNNVHLDSGKHSELNSPGQAGISQLQSTTRGTVQNEPCGDNRLLQPDTVMQHGEVEISYSIGFMHDKLNYTMTAPNSGALWRLWFHPGAVNTATTWLSQRYGDAVNEPATLLDTQTIYQRFHATRKPAELAYPDTPMSSLMDSLVALTSSADGQIRFSSEWHAGVTPLMAAGWQ